MRLNEQDYYALGASAALAGCDVDEAGRCLPDVCTYPQLDEFWMAYEMFNATWRDIYDANKAALSVRAPGWQWDFRRAK